MLIEIKSMPEVDANRDIRPVLARARSVSAGKEPGSAGRAVSIITPGRMIMPINCPTPGTFDDRMMQAVRSLLPENPKHQITVLGNNDVITHKATTPQAATQMIPFLGFLLGFAYDGHNVIVFEGHPTSLRAGLSGTTLLIIDKPLLQFLQKDWAAQALANQISTILVMARDGTIARMAPTGSPPPVK